MCCSWMHVGLKFWAVLKWTGKKEKKLNKKLRMYMFLKLLIFNQVHYMLDKF